MQRRFQNFWRFVQEGAASPDFDDPHDKGGLAIKVACSKEATEQINLVVNFQT